MVSKIEHLSHTKRRPMTRARAARIWLREQGRCYLCTVKLRIGVDKYQIEHPDPLWAGGSDDDADLRVVCHDCHKAKTKAEAADKAKRDRLVTAGWDNGRGSKLQGRGFPRRPPQRTASTPIRRKSDQPDNEEEV